MVVNCHRDRGRGRGLGLGLANRDGRQPNDMWQSLNQNTRYVSNQHGSWHRHGGRRSIRGGHASSPRDVIPHISLPLNSNVENPGDREENLVSRGFQRNDGMALSEGNTEFVASLLIPLSVECPINGSISEETATQEESDEIGIQKRLAKGKGVTEPPFHQCLVFLLPLEDK